MIIEKLKEKIMQERKDCMSYEELAHMAGEEGDEVLSKYLYSIAEDEKSHEIFLHEHIKNHDIKVE